MEGAGAILSLGALGSSGGLHEVPRGGVPDDGYEELGAALHGQAEPWEPEALQNQIQPGVGPDGILTRVEGNTQEVLVGGAEPAPGRQSIETGRGRDEGRIDDEGGHGQTALEAV